MAENASSQPDACALRVLLVEDNPADAELILRELKKAEFEVSADVVEKAEEFRQRICTKTYDIVLSDYSLPQWTGMDALRTLQAEEKKIPFILVTGSLGEERAVACIKEGANDYVLKDQLVRLPRAVRQALEEVALLEQHAQDQAANTLLLTAIDQAAEGIMITDVEGKTVYVNPAFTWMTGYSPEEVLGLSPRLLKSGDEDPTIYREMWETIRSGQTWQGEVVNRRKDGTLYTEWMTIAPVRTEGRAITHYISVKEDITERKRAEEELREKQNWLALAHKAAAVGMFDWDIRSDRARCSDTYFALFGLGPSDSLPSLNWWLERIHPDDRERAQVEVRRTLEHHEPYDTEYRVVWPDRTVHWLNSKARLFFDESGQPLRMTGAMTDITERKRAEEILRESEQRLSLVLDATSEGVWDWNVRTGEVYFSPHWIASLGYSPEEVPPRVSFWESIVHPEDMPRVQELLRAHFEGRTPVYERENRLRTESGEWRWFLDRGKVVERDADGQPLRMVGTDTDITERKQLEEEKRTLEEQYRQAQKMEAVGRLAGGVAHDFNNLLSVILGYSDLLLDTVTPDDSRRQRVEEIKKAAERATSLTRQLLAFSRQQILEPRALSLNAVLADMDKMLGRLIGEDIELVSKPHPSLGRVKADPGQIEQVLMNLAVNARDAMPEGGKLTLETANVDLDESYARNHVAVQPGAYVMLAMSDTGHGMDKETQARIFDPFFTTKEKGKGTGLGLSTVYGIVKQSGGYIWVYSEPGQGTTFKIYLPRIEEPAEEVRAEEGSGVQALGTETILVAEDEEGVRNLLRELLERQGYQVLEAKDGATALERVGQHTGPIHLLLTDVVMPGMSGRALADKVAALRPDVKVVYLSGYTDNAIVHHGVLASGLHFLQKPFTAKALNRKVRQVLDEGKQEHGRREGRER